MSDDIDVALPHNVTFVQELGRPTRLRLTPEQYRELVHALSVVGKYGDPVHWSVYNAMHGRAMRAEHKLTEGQDELRLTTDRQAAEISRLKQQLVDATVQWAGDLGDADTLRATIVRQANEITELKGESA